MKKETTALLQELNPEQRKAVEATEGPVLVLAGAGSGKTRVLTSRIGFLLHEKKVSSREILAMTFTNKAAREMKGRVGQFVDNTENLWIGTFHSIFARILRWETGVLGYSSNFVIYDKDDQERLIKSIMGDVGVSSQQYAPKSVSSIISRSKNSLVDPKEYSQSANSPFEEVVSQIYSEYQSRLRANHAFDFDDLITVPIRLFANHTDILKKYQTRFKYILVDEYQDTNRAQYTLLHHLAREHQNLCVVGDDDQSIYRWRGADIRNILEFEKDFPDAKVFRLEQNYRSTKNILIAATSVVEANVGRKGKILWSERETGDKIDLLEVEDEREEAQRVVESIQKEVFRRKLTFRDFAILYRTNAQSRALEEGLRRSGMSYVIVGGVRFYERKEIKDVLAYLKLITNPKDAVSLKRIINFPLRGIGETTLKRMEKWNREKGMDLFEATKRAEEIPNIPSRITKSIERFSHFIQKYIDLKEKISPNELVRTLVEEAGLLRIYKEDTSIEGQGRAENIKELLAAVSEYAGSTETPSLSGFLEEVSLITDVDTWDEGANAITLMTLHCAKGLEFPVVFITGLEEGLLPVYTSLDEPEALEEERRLFYVGLTRAKEKIYLLWAQRRSRFSEQSFRLPSRFLDELDSAVVETTRLSPKRITRMFQDRVRRQPENHFEPHPAYESFSQEMPLFQRGTYVEHESFGRGRVMSVEGTGVKQKVTVKFDSGIQKKFLVKYSRFTIV